MKGRTCCLMTPPPSNSLLYTKVRLYFSIQYFIVKNKVINMPIKGLVPLKVSPRANITMA